MEERKDLRSHLNEQPRVRRVEGRRAKDIPALKFNEK